MPWYHFKLEIWRPRYIVEYNEHFGSEIEHIRPSTRFLQSHFDSKTIPSSRLRRRLPSTFMCFVTFTWQNVVEATTMKVQRAICWGEILMQLRQTQVLAERAYASLLGDQTKGNQNITTSPADRFRSARLSLKTDGTTSRACAQREIYIMNINHDYKPGTNKYTFPNNRRDISDKPLHTK